MVITKKEAQRLFMAGAMWEQEATDQNFNDVWDGMIKNDKKYLLIGFMNWFNNDNRGAGTDCIKIEEINEYLDRNESKALT